MMACYICGGSCWGPGRDPIYLHGAEIFPESMVDDDTRPRGPKGVLWSFHMWIESMSTKDFPKDKLNDHHENGIWTAQIPAWRQANCFPLRIAYSIKTLQGLLIFSSLSAKWLSKISHVHTYEHSFCTHVYNMWNWQSCRPFLEYIELDSAEKNGNSKLLHAVVNLLGDLCHYFIDPPGLSVPRQHFGDGVGLGFGILELGRRCSSYLLHVHFLSAISKEKC